MSESAINPDSIGAGYPEEQTPQEPQEAALTGVQESADPKAPATQQEAVKRAYSEATTALRKAHRDEFNADVAKRVEAYGFEWKPKPTAKEKALAEVQRLMAEHDIKPSNLL
jgi:hypothetical protein